MTYEQLAATLLLGMALQAAINGVVNRGKPVQLGEAITKAMTLAIVAGIIYMVAGQL